MRFNIKFITLISFVFICTSLGITVWNSHSSKIDDKALYFLQNGETNKALLIAEELEKNSTSAKFPLYQAYILREKNQINQSTAALKKSLRPSKTGKNPALLAEIHLNLILNDYLKGDTESLRKSLKTLKQLRHLENSIQQKSHYIDLFGAIEAYQNKNYEKALFLFQKHKTYFSFSPWMKQCFEKQFSPFWIKKQIVRCLIEEGKFSQAQLEIDEMKSLALPNETSTIHALRMLGYFQAALNKPLDQQTVLHTLALTELSKISKRELVFQELNEINSNLKVHLLKHLNDKSWDQFGLYLKSSAAIEIDSITTLLHTEIDSRLMNGQEEDAFSLLQKIEGESRLKLLYRLKASMEESLNNGKLARLKSYINFMQPLIETKEFDETSLASQIADFSFDCLKNRHNRLETGISLLQFWHKMEKNPEQKTSFAKKLVSQAEVVWRQKEQFSQALELFKIALELPEKEDKVVISDLLERSFALTYQKALDSDAVDQLIYIVKAVKALRLKSVNIYSTEEKNQHLNDAEIFLSKGYYKQSHKKASLVLAVEPENEKAKRILGMIAYENANHEEALAYFKTLRQPDSTVLEIIKLLQPKIQPKIN